MTYVHHVHDFRCLLSSPHKVRSYDKYSAFIWLFRLIENSSKHQQKGHCLTICLYDKQCSIVKAHCIPTMHPKRFFLIKCPLKHQYMLQDSASSLEYSVWQCLLIHIWRGWRCTEWRSGHILHPIMEGRDQRLRRGRGEMKTTTRRRRRGRGETKVWN